MADKELNWDPTQGFLGKAAQAAERLEILISHSKHDEELAKRLIALIRFAFGIKTKSIRCSSVDGHRFEIGKIFQDQLRHEIAEAHVFIALLTPDSLKSHWVAFEIGARWQTGKACFPLLSGVSTDEMQSIPLSSTQALSCGNEAQLYQFISDLGKNLEREPEEPASLHEWVLRMVELSNSGPSNSMLDGEIGIDSKWGSSWIELAHPRDFRTGDRLRIFLGGGANSKRKPAGKVLVRLLRAGENPGKNVGVLTPQGVLVPKNRILEVEVNANFNEVVQISVHGGEQPWDYFLGKGNGPATLTRAEVVSLASRFS